VPIANIDAVQLSAWLADEKRPAPVLLDVREAWEFELCRLPGSVHIPMSSVPARVTELDAAREIVVICHHGGRSMQVAAWLDSRGFVNLHNLTGGVNAWARHVDSTMAVY
jgi:rhodanese-related sulfurtransferase